ncbi:hypothetical protein BGX27_005554 [Mortierella sp. AM989]|nr:hypothetical protein BGX27_005554 [Mortierella sp. AM989]
MGAHSSKIDNKTSSSKFKKRRQSQSSKDLGDLSITNSETSWQLTERDDSQLTGETSAKMQAASAISSKTNISSFLSSFKYKSKDKDASDCGISVEDHDMEAEEPRLSDLREQMEQKKFNRMNQKAQKQLQKQQPSASSTQSIPATLPSSTSTKLSSVPSIGDNSLRIISSKASSVSAAYIGSKNSIHSNVSAVTSIPVSQQGVQPTTDVLPPVVSQESSSSLNLIQLPAPISTPNSLPQQSRTSKLSFIRSKAGFAWLEKKLLSSSSSSSNKVLDENAMGSQQDQLLDQMEMEAANGYFDRVTDQHFLMKDVMGGNYHVPMDLTFKNVLENGCGAGDWTLDMASEMPETDFVGCPQITFTASPPIETASPALRPRGLLGADLSQQGSTPPQALHPVTSPSPNPNLSTSTKLLVRPKIHPRNCNFHTEVPINRLPFSDERFDFVYQRRQGIVLMSTEWQRVILELFRVLKCGGWIEILEPDHFLRGGGELCKLAGEYCIALFESMGRNPTLVHEMQQLLASAGFVNITAKVWSIPLGWGGPIGQAMLVNQRQFVNELEPIYVRQGHGDSQEYRETTKSIFEEAVEMKAYINYHVITAQKPASALDQ